MGDWNHSYIRSELILVYASGWKTARVDVLLFEYGDWVGWGGILTFMYIPCVHTWMLRRCYVTGQGLGGVGWDINVHVSCVHTWMLRCCYVTGQGLGGVGWDINVHVPCVHTWTSLVRGWVGWGGILTFMYLAYIRGCYAAAASETWSQKNLGDKRCPMLP